MTYLSPILQQQINTNSQSNKRHEEIYKNLTRHANDVKPNQAKAKLIKQNPVSSVISSVGDNAKDCANFVKAVKTGKMNDNSLGRINDIGMKAGALLIASFLATHAKTKTDSIMQFIGGTTFFASMALWPKLFINLPARIIHGFNIGQRYVSAQGDKKDFFLDNQFLPWDAYSKEELTQIGKRTGIDYNSENGEEKIKRKMQKTALQNRTLWMATAGFATPLLTAMAGNVIEPQVRNAVIKNGYDKASEIIHSENGLAEYLNSATEVPKYRLLHKFIKNKNQNLRQQKFNDLFKQYQNRTLDDSFYKELADLLDLSSVTEQFKDMDDITPIKKAVSFSLDKALKQVREEMSTVKEESLKEKLAGLKTKSIARRGLSVEKTLLSETQISSIIEELKTRGFTIKNLKEVLENQGHASYTEAILKTVDVDETAFFEAVKKYDSEVLSLIRERLSAYLKLINSTAGSKSESYYTKEYQDTMQRLFSKLGFKFEDLKEIRQDGIKDASNTVARGVEAITARGKLIQHFSEFAQRTASMTEEEYLKELQAYVAPLDSNAKGLASSLVSQENLSKIKVGANAELSMFDKVSDILLEGSEESKKGIFQNLKRFIQLKDTDINAIKSKILISANFERRVQNGSFKEALQKSGLLSEGLNYEEWLEVARSLVYDGTVSKDACKVDIHQAILSKKTNSSMPEILNNLKGIIFSKESFEQEEQVLPGIKGIVEQLKNLGYEAVLGLPMNPNETVYRSKEYTLSGSFAQAVKKHATNLFNNKSWMKKFGVMTAVLIGVTLLVQPFFGNIKKEYPENKQGGTK